MLPASAPPTVLSDFTFLPGLHLHHHHHSHCLLELVHTSFCLQCMPPAGSAILHRLTCSTFCVTCLVSTKAGAVTLPAYWISAGFHTGFTLPCTPPTCVLQGAPAILFLPHTRNSLPRLEFCYTILPVATVPAVSAMPRTLLCGRHHGYLPPRYACYRHSLRLATSPYADNLIYRLDFALPATTWTCLPSCLPPLHS